MDRQRVARWVLVGMALFGVGALAVAFGAALGPEVVRVVAARGMG